MKALYLSILLAVMVPPSHGQMYLLTGSSNWLNVWYVATDLFEVQTNGDVRLVARIVPEKTGTQWMSASYEWRKLVILPGPDSKRIIVVDFDKAGVSKVCDLPQFPDESLTEQWLADLPGAGQSFVGRTSGVKQRVYALRLDTTIPCSGSVIDAGTDSMRYLVAQGRAGVGSLGTGNGPAFGLDADGVTFDRKMGAKTLLGYTVPSRLRSGLIPGKQFTRIVAETSQLLVLSLYQEDLGLRLIALDKGTRIWRAIPAESENVRAFGDYVAIVESRDRTGHEQQMQSAGRSEWRRTPTEYGPAIGLLLDEANAQFTGRLHIYDAGRDRLFTITTNQADSEILLIDKQTVYYRIIDRLYAADITDKGVQEARLIVKSDIIDDVHWAFMGPAGR